MKRMIGIISGIIGSVLTALAISAFSGVKMFTKSVNVIGGADAPTFMLLMDKGYLKHLFIALLAGIALVVISYCLLFRKKK